MENKCIKKIAILAVFVLILFTPKFSQAITDTLTGNTSEVTDTQVTLSGSLNPEGTDASGYFRYSAMDIPPIFCNDIYGSKMRSTFEEKLGSGNGAIAFSTTVTDLTPATIYYYCAVGSNNSEITYGGVKSFSTLGKSGQLVVTTEAANVKDSNSAYINGTFISGNAANTWFEYRKQGSQNDNSWTKVDQESHKQGETGKMNYLLANLSAGTQYEFRATIIDASGMTEIKTKKSPLAIYGEILTFTTREKGNIKPVFIGSGTPYTNPCADPDDGNCNGTGTGGTPPWGGSSKPDLTASKVTPSYGKVNTPIVLMALIRNQGGSTTVNSFPNFIQISLVNPTKANTNTTGSNAISFNYLFHPTAAHAENTAEAVSDPNLINLASAQTGPLQGGGVATISSTYTFLNIGTYYARACADKSSPSSVGLITESYEFNNCSPWSSIIINTDGTSTGGSGNGTGGNNPPFGGGTGTGGGTTSTTGQTATLTLGQTATPPIDAVVHYHEGIETVLQRQIVANMTLAKVYGYEEGTDLQAYSWYLADFFARIFGYVSTNGKEIRVTEPDVAAYQIEYLNGKLTIYEYYNSKIVNIQQMTPDLRGIYGYEYYFVKR